MASIHFRQQRKRKIYWTYTENFLRTPLAYSSSTITTPIVSLLAMTFFFGDMLSRARVLNLKRVSTKNTLQYIR